MFLEDSLPAPILCAALPQQSEPSACRYAQETPGETPLFGAASAAARSSCADAHMCELSSAPNCPVSPQSSGSGTDSQASRSRGKSTNSTSETGTTRRKSSVSGTESNRSGRKASTSSSASDASDPDEAAFLHLQDRTAGKRRSSRVSPDRRLSFGSKVSVPARSGPLMGTNH